MANPPYWPREGFSSSNALILIRLYENMRKAVGQRNAYFALWSLLLALDALGRMLHNCDEGRYQAAAIESKVLLEQLRDFAQDFQRFKPQKQPSKGIPSS